VLTPAEQAALTVACRLVPLTKNTYIADDYLLTLLATVIDYQQHTTTVERAIAYFKENHAGSVRTFNDLKALLDRFPDDRDGNTALAQQLWNYRLWRRASELRGLAAFFDGQGIDDLDKLRAWATSSSFRKDFEGRVKGLGRAVYQWLVMRLGVETVKPDVHIVRFVSGAIKRPASEGEAVSGVEEAAVALGIKANLLDWSIWEYSRT
jgi:hypothetical protein